MKRLFKGLLLFGIATVMTACGDEQEITKKDENSNGISSDGILTKGEFSVARGKKVRFSQGNLQYQASTNTWRFAEHQWDFVGDEFDGTVYENEVKSNNKNVAEDYDGWIDLFGWGTSGYNGKYPYMTSNASSDYGDGENDIAGTNYDWGVYNKISNGGNKAGMWRTLTEDEWYYLLFERPHCNDLYSAACVDGIDGFIVLPDDWKSPESVTFIPKENYRTNDYNLMEWSKIESHGAVFFPLAGEWANSKYDHSYYKYHCIYWTASSYVSEYSEDDFEAWTCAFGYVNKQHDYFVDTESEPRQTRVSVRLVQDVK